MRVSLNCTKPTLFAGHHEDKSKLEEQQPVVVQVKVKVLPAPQIQQQPAKDTVEISTKKPEAKCEGDACKEACKK